MWTSWTPCTSSCPSTFKGVEPSQSYSGHCRGSSSPVQWTDEVPSQFLAVGSQGLGDASLQWMRYPCLISGVQHIQPPWDRVLSLLCWLWLSFREASQYFASIVEVFIISRTMYQYIVYIYIAYACDIACQYFIGHTTLKERARALEASAYDPFETSFWNFFLVFAYTLLDWHHAHPYVSLFINSSSSTYNLAALLLGSIQTVHTEWWKPYTPVNQDAEVPDAILRWNQ